MGYKMQYPELTNREYNAMRDEAKALMPGTYQMGRDAKAQGYSFTACPFVHFGEGARRVAWQYGWIDEHTETTPIGK